jgi:multidrug efflux pump
MLSDLSVRRPVFAAVAAIILCVIGLAAFATLPIRELPSVDPPVVSVSTAYRGASAEVIEERITQVIERQVAGIQGHRSREQLVARRPFADHHHLQPRP